MRLALPFVIAAALMSTPAAAERLTWPDLTARPHPKASATIAYGTDPLQVGDLWLPDGRGPFPVVVMVHGGCGRPTSPNAI